MSKLNIELLDASDGFVRLQWHPPDWTRVPAGWVQGGFLGVPLDFAETLAALTALSAATVVVTLDMSINFLEPALAQSFVVSGRVERMGRTIAYTSGEVHDSDGKRIATATATNMLRKVKVDGTS